MAIYVTYFPISSLTISFIYNRFIIYENLYVYYPWHETPATAQMISKHPFPLLIFSSEYNYRNYNV